MRRAETLSRHVRRSRFASGAGAFAPSMARMRNTTIEERILSNGWTFTEDGELLG